VLADSPLILLRNVAVYVSLIGALAAIVVGNRLVGLDRRAGVLPLYGTRTGDGPAYMAGKALALLTLIAGLALIAGLVSGATLLSLPAVAVTPGQWMRFAAFFALSSAYMLFFGLVGIGAAARSRSETVGLMLPVTLWLVLTFVLPSVTANILPTASINPVSALVVPPDAAFFRWTAFLVGPVSVAESYRFVSAGLLDYLPAGRVSVSAIPPLATLILATLGALIWSLRGLTRLDMTRGDYDV
jgi:ABC-type transport system involved in multi-copper enzyme maturation permease subunit